MATEFQKSFLSIKEVKTFNLFDYVYPDLDDQYLPYWDEDKKIWFYNEIENTWSFIS